MAEGPRMMSGKQELNLVGRVRTSSHDKTYIRILNTKFQTFIMSVSGWLPHILPTRSPSVVVW